MLKILGRIAIILVVAGILSGGLYFFANSTVGQSVLANGRGGFDGGSRIHAPGGQTSFTGQPPADFGGGERDFAGGRALSDLGGKLVQMGLVMAVVVLGGKALARIPRKRKASAA